MKGFKNNVTPVAMNTPSIQALVSKYHSQQKESNSEVGKAQGEAIIFIVPESKEVLKDSSQGEWTSTLRFWYNFSTENFDEVIK